MTTSIDTQLFTALSESAQGSTTRAQRLAEKAGLKYLGNGASRIAFERPDGRVLKVNYNTHTWGNQLEREVQRWQERKDSSMAEFFLPIEEWDKDHYSWAVYPKAENVGSLSNLVDLKRRMANAIAWEGHNYDEYIRDTSVRNVGLYQGRPVFIDYGY